MDLKLSVKQAMKQEKARIVRRMNVIGPVAESHEPLLVKIGVRIWKAKRVPVGRRFAKLAVVAKVCDMALCAVDCCGGSKVSVECSSSSELEESDVFSFGVATGLDLRVEDMFKDMMSWGLS